MMLQALLFDCDGVLAETESEGHRVAFNETFKARGINAFWDTEEYGRLVEIGGGKERMAYYFGKDPKAYPPETFNADYIASLHREKTTRFMSLCKTLPPRPGVKRLMLEAAAQGRQVFICSTSNEKSVQAIADNLLGSDRKDIITHIYAGDAVKAKKPAPDIYLLALEEYDLDPAACVVVEDTRIGMLAAKAAGISCLVTMSMYSRKDDFTEADMVVDNLGEPDAPCLPVKGIPAGTRIIDLALLDRLIQ